MCVESRTGDFAREATPHAHIQGRLGPTMAACSKLFELLTFLSNKHFTFSVSGVGVINASPNSMGLLTNRGPPDWHPALLYTPVIAETCREASAYCDEKGVDISRLALHFSLEQKDCSTCLVSTASKRNAEKNLKVVSHPLDKHENQLLQEVMDKFMKPLNNAHWEGFEREALLKGEFVG